MEVKMLKKWSNSCRKKNVGPKAFGKTIGEL
jgi:hypothetical protein